MARGFGERRDRWCATRNKSLPLKRSSAIGFRTASTASLTSLTFLTQKNLLPTPRKRDSKGNSRGFTSLRPQESPISAIKSVEKVSVKVGLRPVIIVAENIVEKALQSLQSFGAIVCAYNLNSEELCANIAECDILIVSKGVVVSRVVRNATRGTVKVGSTEVVGIADAAGEILKNLQLCRVKLHLAFVSVDEWVYSKFHPI